MNDDINGLSLPELEKLAESYRNQIDVARAAQMNVAFPMPDLSRRLDAVEAEIDRLKSDSNTDL